MKCILLKLSAVSYQLSDLKVEDDILNADEIDIQIRLYEINFLEITTHNCQV